MTLTFVPRLHGVIIEAMWWSRCFATAALASFLGCASSPVPRPVERAAVAPTTVASKSEVRATTSQDSANERALADARHLLNRFAFGPRPGEVERVARQGRERWLETQLALPEESPLLEATLVPHRSAFAPPVELVNEWLGEGWESDMRDLRELRREAKPQFRAHVQRLATAEVTRDILSTRQLEAVMTDFWANHFNVFAAKGVVRVFEGDYLERALRPHALGRFSELLLATARHPAMLIYLDNAGSRREGLNENYARELLELHTLGVDGGYTQDDVREVARILTGWSVERVREGSFTFAFRARAHDRRAKTVLGEAFPKGGKEEEGVRLLEMLARHPSTARHLARQLCARFVADDPPASCVTAASRAFVASDGDIKAVLRAIASDASFWSEQARGGKLKKPLELLASAARAVGARPDGNLELASTLADLGEPLLQERVPTGYPDSAPEWASAGGMLARMAFAGRLAAGEVRGLVFDWEELKPVPDSPELAAWLGRELLGASAQSRTVQLVSEEVAKMSDFEQRRATALGLLLGSPEFQRQ